MTPADAIAFLGEKMAEAAADVADLPAEKVRLPIVWLTAIEANDVIECISDLLLELQIERTGHRLPPYEGA